MHILREDEFHCSSHDEQADSSKKKKCPPVLGLQAFHLSDTNFPPSAGKIYLETRLNSFERYLLYEWNSGIWFTEEIGQMARRKTHVNIMCVWSFFKFFLGLVLQTYVLCKMIQSFSLRMEKLEDKGTNKKSHCLWNKDLIRKRLKLGESVVSKGKRKKKAAKKIPGGSQVWRCVDSDKKQTGFLLP